jgi:class 3 adenylate cyclase/predicted ATPase
LSGSGVSTVASVMKFEEILDEVIALLQRRGRMTYRALKRQFDLDDEYLADLRDELIKGQRVAVDEGGEVLVWAGSPAARPAEEPARPEPNAAIAPPASPPQRAQGERRHLTVMFCDMVGSTALSSRLDPEDFRDILNTYHSICGSVVAQLDGHISQHLGDGVLAYFGYPVAHEDDARRAVKSALAIVPAIMEYSAQLEAAKGIRLPVRIGIHTGVVVVGVTGAAAAEWLATGETPNIAARIQGLAEPNSVLLSEATKRLVEKGFEFMALGRKAISGLAEPMEVYRAVRELDADANPGTDSGPADETELVGRESEVQLLLDRWEQAKTCMGQVVLVCGDPGIGKSRLVRTLHDRVQREGRATLVFRCSPYHLNSALHPVIDRLRREAGLLNEDTVEAKRQRLMQWLQERSFLQSETQRLFSALLSIPLQDGQTETGALSQGQKRLVYEHLVQWLVDIALERSLLVVWEDVHWADPSTLDLISLLIEQAPTTAMLALVTFRPEFQPPWKHSSNRFQFIISRFTPSQVETMLARLTGGKRFPAEMMRLLVVQTDGVPLFVEEVTKLLLESGSLHELEDRYELKGPLAALSIPTTLHDSLMARLDRQTSGREVAQLGATLGREFSAELLKAVWPHDQKRLTEGLAQLLDAGLLYRRGLGSQTSYFFKHVLVQEVAYESLLRRTREEYHGRIVRVLEERFPGMGSTQPEVLAHHYTGAGLIEQAIPYWRSAGERAIETSAHAEAIGHVSKAIDLLGSLPSSPDKVRNEITLHIRLGVSLTALRGYGASEVERAYGRARELCYSADVEDLMLPSLYGLWRFCLMRANFSRAKELGNELLELAQRYDNQEFLTVGHRALGTTLFYLCDLDPARKMMTLVLDAHSDSERRVLAFRYDVVDAWVTGRAYHSWLSWLMGDTAAAVCDSDEATTTAQRLKHPFSHALALSFSSWLHQFRGDVARVRECAAAATAVSREHGFEFWMGWNAVLQGWATSAGGDSRAGTRQIQEGIKQWRATGSELGRSYFLGLLAESHLMTGEFEEGLLVLDEAFQFSALTGERFWEAELHRVKGELLAGLRRPDPEVAACFARALSVAKAQGAKALQMRAEASEANHFHVSPLARDTA